VVQSKITPTEILPTTIPTATPTQTDYADSIDISLLRLILKPGETKQLYVEYNPENPRNKNLTWSVSNNSIISITTDGLVKALRVGTATVTVKTENNLSDTMTVYVHED
jgi:alpha-amylase